MKPDIQSKEINCLKQNSSDCVESHHHGFGALIIKLSSLLPPPTKSAYSVSERLQYSPAITVANRKSSASNHNQIHLWSWLSKYAFSALCVLQLLAPERAAARDECGTGQTVTCGDATYSAGIDYLIRQNGLKITVGRNGSAEIKPPTNGSGVKIVAWTTATGDIEITIKALVSILQNSAGDGKYGLFAQQRGTEGTSITIENGVNIGSADSRMGEYGIYSFHTNEALQAPLIINNNGNIYSDGASVRNGAGIFASRNDGGGRIELINGGQIDSKKRGLYAYHGGEGKIIITNSGQIASSHRGIVARQGGSGGIVITHSGGKIVSEDWGIFARKDGTGGAIIINSSADIEAKGSGKHAILVDRRGAATATDVVEVNVTGGTIKASGSGVAITQHTRGGITVKLGADAAIGTEDNPVGGSGIGASIVRGQTQNAKKLLVEVLGKIHSTSPGLSLSHAGSGDIEAVVGESGSINSHKHRGITTGHSGSGKIKIINRGSIISNSHGILASHAGTGNIEVTNSGTISAKGLGIRANRSHAGRILITNTEEGTIVSTDHGIFVRNDGPGAEGEFGIEVKSSGDITTNGYRRTGIYTQTRSNSAAGRIYVEHTGGKIESHNGISAILSRFSGSDYSSTSIPQIADYEDTDQPVIHIVLSGEINARVLDYDPSLTESVNLHQVGWKTRSLVPRFDGARGITVGTIDSQAVGQFVAAGDADSTTITAEIRNQFRSVMKSAIEFSESPGNELSLGLLFDPRDIVSLGSFDPNIDISTDALLDAYLKSTNDDGVSLLSKFLRYTLSSKERQVIEALFKNKEGLNNALEGLPENYTEQIRWYADAYNSANILIEVEDGGVINSEGDGIRARHILEHDKNGSILVRVKQGGVVVASRHGANILGAGITASGRRDQTVEIGGHLESTLSDGAGIYLVGGGKVVVKPEGTIITASGVPINVEGTGILVVEIELQQDETLVDATRRAINGRILNDIEKTELSFVSPDGTKRTVPHSTEQTDYLVDGAFDVGIISGTQGFRVVHDYAPRARVYEALPSALLGMSDTPRLRERASAPRDSNGFYVNLTTKSGSWKPNSSTTSTSYNHRYTGLTFGNTIWQNENQSVDIFLNYGIGAANVKNGGRIGVTRTGIGISHSWDTDQYYVDFSGSVSAFHIDLNSHSRGMLKSGQSGQGYSFNAEAGYKIKMSSVAITPSVGFGLSSVRTGSFTDKLGVKVSSLQGMSRKLRLGSDIEMPIRSGRLFGSFFLEKDFGNKSSVSVQDLELSSTSRNTVLHLGGGIDFSGQWEGTSLKAGVNYGSKGSVREFRGTLTTHF